MELLDLLEARVSELLTQADGLRAENARLAAQAAHEAARRQALQDENQALQATLHQEQRLRDAVLERIDTLLERLKDVDSDA